MTNIVKCSRCDKTATHTVRQGGPKGRTHPVCSGHGYEIVNYYQGGWSMVPGLPVVARQIPVDRTLFGLVPFVPPVAGQLALFG